jgi:hypothetical protein
VNVPTHAGCDQNRLPVRTALDSHDRRMTTYTTTRQKADVDTALDDPVRDEIVGVLIALERHLKALASETINNVASTTRDERLAHVRHHIDQLRPVLSEVAPTVLDLLDDSSGANNNQLADTVLTANREVFLVLRELGIGPYHLVRGSVDNGGVKYVGPPRCWRTTVDGESIPQTYGIAHST